MATLTIIANLHAHPDQIDLVRAELEKLIPFTRNEQGCITYDLHQNNDDPAHFTLFEIWASRDQWQAHMQTPHLTAFVEATRDALAKSSLTEMTRIG